MEGVIYFTAWEKRMVFCVHDFRCVPWRWMSAERDECWIWVVTGLMENSQQPLLQCQLRGRDPTNDVVSSCHNLNMIYGSGYPSEELACFTLSCAGLFLSSAVDHILLGSTIRILAQSVWICYFFC